MRHRRRRCRHNVRLSGADSFLDMVDHRWRTMLMLSHLAAMNRRPLCSPTSTRVLFGPSLAIDTSWTGEPRTLEWLTRMVMAKSTKTTTTMAIRRIWLRAVWMEHGRMT